MKKDTTILENDFTNFVKEIKAKILSSQYEALKAVNKELINLYWEIGKNIVEKQEEFGWGKAVVQNLSNELQKEFIGIKGFSMQNLWNMRQFYLEYYQNEKLQPLVGEISWTKNVIIFQKCKDNLEREFYIKTTIKFGMTKDVLINQIENKSYEKFLLNQTNFENTIVEKYKNQAILAVKDEYNFDFLSLSEKYDENPSIGIIICKDKKRTTVEYALKDSNQPIGVATYKLTETLPKEYKNLLPTTKEISKKLENLLEDLKNE